MRFLVASLAGVFTGALLAAQLLMLLDAGRLSRPVAWTLVGLCMIVGIAFGCFVTLFRGASAVVGLQRAFLLGAVHWALWVPVLIFFAFRHNAEAGGRYLANYLGTAAGGVIGGAIPAVIGGGACLAGFALTRSWARRRQLVP